LIFKRGSSFTLVLALAALLAACAYVVQRPTGGRMRSEAAIALASLPSPAPVRVSHVVDGDTFHVFVTLRSGEIVRAPLRIRGIDTPEMKGACEEEKYLAHQAANALAELLAGGDVLVDTISTDKYERILARVLVQQNGARRDVADLLVSAGYARVYTGRKRAGWC
jgi:micrococcal nuclease